MRTCLLISFAVLSINSFAQDLNWNTSAIPNNSLSFNFGSIGSPASAVTYAVTGPGTITAGPARFVTVQPANTWRTAITFGAVSELKTYTLTFNPAVCGLTFIVYDIDGDNTSGDRCIITANYLGVPQNITMAALDPSPPTITGSGTATATGTGTQGNQTDDRVQITIPGCVSTLTLQYGNNPAGAAGGRSFSIGNLNWITSTLPVTFISFNGQKINDGVVRLNWNTGAEFDAGQFYIERSTDGENFTVAGSVAATNSASAYTFNDNTSTTQILFYRIRHTDLDGRSQYSKTIALKFGNNQNGGITIFPNPPADHIFITTNNNLPITQVEFFDAGGRLVQQEKNPGNRFDISKLGKGLYRVRVVDRDQNIYTATFLK